MTTYYGTANDDTLTYFDWNSGWTIFQMGSGNDIVVAPSTNTAYVFFGEGGNDLFQGSSRTDNAAGGIGNDTLVGAGGGDFLSGDGGNDRIIGGRGTDWLKGGEGTDTFVFSRGDSPSIDEWADHILDWDMRADYIDSMIKGTSGNYAEFWVSYTDIFDVQYALQASPYKTKDHIFAYNEDADTRYLLSDLDNDSNNVFETAVVIQGASSAADMNGSDII